MNLTKKRSACAYPFKLFFIVVVLSLLAFDNLLAQQSKIKIKGIKVSKLNLNFDANGKVLKYLSLEDNNAAPRAIVSKETFSLTDNYSNINFRWKNPLKYKFTWKDSTYADEQQAALKDFLKLLNPLFNLPSENAGSSNSQNLTAAKDKINEKENAKKKADDKIKNPLVVQGSFKDYDLSLLYIQLILGQESLLTEQERIDLNKFTPKLLDLEKGDTDYQSKAMESFRKLFNVTDPLRVTNASEDGVADIESDNVDAWGKSLKDNQNLHSQVLKSLEDIKIENAMVNSLFHTSIAKYLDKNKTLNSTNLSIVNKLTPVIETLKNSVTDDSKPFAYGNISDLVHIRSVKLEEGKVLQTELVITTYKIADDGFNIEKESESERVTLTFRGYDPVNFSVSTGLFYGNTSLKGFGTANSGANMTVTEDTIESNTAVIALFGNLTFGIRSKLLAPTIQLGIDPTKKHPFFLLGGGLVFPAANFAITSGGIWTFEPTLSTLKVGQTISSTTELDKDIKNNFQIEPKGWYLGIQYNF